MFYLRTLNFEYENSALSKQENPRVNPYLLKPSNLTRFGFKALDSVLHYLDNAY